MNNSDFITNLYSKTNDLCMALNDFSQSNRYFVHDHFICTCLYSKNDKKWCITITLGTCQWFIDCSTFEFKGSSSNKLTFPTCYRGIIDLYLELFQNLFNDEHSLE